MVGAWEDEVIVLCIDRVLARLETGVRESDSEACFWYRHSSRVGKLEGRRESRFAYIEKAVGVPVSSVPEDLTASILILSSSEGVIEARSCLQSAALRPFGGGILLTRRRLDPWMRTALVGESSSELREAGRTDISGAGLGGGVKGVYFVLRGDSSSLMSEELAATSERIMLGLAWTGSNRPLSAAAF